jgi:2-oxoglutarate dehydrogenase complex dehydrogenase (E1) component-like enzyme
MTPETISALIQMGSAGAVIAVVIIFLKNIKELTDNWVKSNKERDAEWRDFFTALSSGNRENIAEMRNVAANLVQQLEDLNKRLDTHDVQAKSILKLVDQVKSSVDRLLAGITDQK